MVIAALGFGSMFILFTVVPIQAAQSGGSLGAGVAMTALMGSTLATHAVMPALMRRVTSHTLLRSSLWLMTLPSIALMWNVGLPIVLVATTVRGIGIGAMIVVCTALVSLYAEGARQGAALGRYGLATSLTGMVAPPLGLALLGVWTASPATLAVLGPLVALMFLGAIRRGPSLPMRHSASTSGPADDRRMRRLTRGMAIFLPAALVYGWIYTFVPMVSEFSVAVLLAFGLGFAVGRLAGGRSLDRWSPTTVLAPFSAITLASTVGLVVSSQPVAEVLFAGLVGTGVGGIASGTLTMLMRKSSPDDYALVSAAWNITFDAGIALGGLGFGFLFAAFGYGAAVAAMVASLLISFLLIIWAMVRRRDPSY